MESRNFPNKHHQFGNKHQAAELLGVSHHTLKKWRRIDQCLLEGIHWIRLNPRAIRYNLPLLADWLQHCNDPAAHQQAIEKYLSSLGCNQPKRRQSDSTKSTQNRRSVDSDTNKNIQGPSPQIPENPEDPEKPDELT